MARGISKLGYLEAEVPDRCAHLCAAQGTSPIFFSTRRRFSFQDNEDSLQLAGGSGVKSKLGPSCFAKMASRLIKSRLEVLTSPRSNSSGGTLRPRCVIAARISVLLRLPFLDKQGEGVREFIGKEFQFKNSNAMKFTTQHDLQS